MRFNVFQLALRNLLRRPLRTGLVLMGLAAALTVLLWLSAFGAGYQHALAAELDRMGMQLMLVPLGCPYDAAARVIKGNTLDTSMPDSALDLARNDPAVAVAAPLLIAAVPREREHRVDVWVGIDPSARALKPWWVVKQGSEWFVHSNSVIIGSEAAEVEMRKPGDKLFSPETGREFGVTGILERSGTSDDSLFFVPLATAQSVFHQAGRITAVAIRLKDPALLKEASARLQAIPGAQVVTLTEMMGAFLNLLVSVRTLSRAVAFIALTISVLSLFNTLLATVVERGGELSIMRALGASRAQVFGLVSAESLLLTGAGSLIGIGISSFLGKPLELVAVRFVPFSPAGSMSVLSARTVIEGVTMALAVGLVAGLYPAWRASCAQPAQALRQQ